MTAKMAGRIYRIKTEKKELSWDYKIRINQNPKQRNKEEINEKRL